ncbi:MAG: glycosyltransferase [Planctomycetota bacterium]|nr:glycosyltransferase [Planctomycetota bacterium]
MLLVSHEGRIGGAERSLLLLIQHLVQQGGMHVGLACPPGGPLAAEAGSLGCRIFPLSSRPRVGGISLIEAVKWIGLSMQVRRACVAFRPDIVHANSVYSMALCWFLWPRGRTKVVWHVRDLPRRRAITRLCGRLSDRVIAVSGAVKERLLSQGLDGDSIDVIHNGIEPPTASMIDQRPSFIPFSDRNDGRIVFANVGQFVPWKKQTLFLAAAALVAPPSPSHRRLQLPTRWGHRSPVPASRSPLH